MAVNAAHAWLDRYYAAPQTLVRIGRRRRLNLVVMGEGAPTVIFAAGLNGTSLHWARVQHAIARRTRTVAFDKAGMGFSDPGQSITLPFDRMLLANGQVRQLTLDRRSPRRRELCLE